MSDRQHRDVLMAFVMSSPENTKPTPQAIDDQLADALADVARLESRAAELEAALLALVEAMPRCQHGGCRLHAVARHIGTGLVCEVHAASISELRLSALPLSPQLRAALLLLAKGWTR